MGEVFEMVRGTVATRLQSEEMARPLEADALYERKVEGTAGLDANSADGGGTEALFPKLPGERTGCLK